MHPLLCDAQRTPSLRSSFSLQMAAPSLRNMQLSITPKLTHLSYMWPALGSPPGAERRQETGSVGTRGKLHGEKSEATSIVIFLA